MDFKAEAAFLPPFFERAQKQGFLAVCEIHRSLQDKLGRKVELSSVYSMLHRHGCRNPFFGTKSEKTEPCEPHPGHPNSGTWYNVVPEPPPSRAWTCARILHPASAHYSQSSERNFISLQFNYLTHLHQLLYTLSALHYIQYMKEVYP